MRKMKQRGERGQVTFFVIIGIAIVAIAVLIYLFFPKISSTLGFAEENPVIYIEKCAGDKINEVANSVAVQGGSLEPKNYYIYNEEKIEYLCYTNEDFKTCSIQEPLLKQHIEDEIKTGIKTEIESCIKSMEDNFRKRGYQTTITNESSEVKIMPNAINVLLGNKISLQKGEETQNYEMPKIESESRIYELIFIANSILNWEAEYGDSETTTYMNYYHDLKIEKRQQSDGTTIYILTKRNTGDKFQFASRSLIFK